MVVDPAISYLACLRIQRYTPPSIYLSEDWVCPSLDRFGTLTASQRYVCMAPSVATCDRPLVEDHSRRGAGLEVVGNGGSCSIIIPFVFDSTAEKMFSCISSFLDHIHRSVVLVGVGRWVMGNGKWEGGGGLAKKEAGNGARASVYTAAG